MLEIFLRLYDDIVKELTTDLPTKEEVEYCEDCGEPVDKCSGYKCWER